MPQSLQSRKVRLRASTPSRWPITRGRLRCFAQRPLPSMITATWTGRRAGSRPAGMGREAFAVVVARARLIRVIPACPLPRYAQLARPGPG